VRAGELSRARVRGGGECGLRCYSSGMETNLRKPWLVAVWPGMGGVAQIAGSYLVRKLGAEPIAELDARAFFDVDSISIKDGLVQPAGHSRNVFYGWRNPDGMRDLLILIAERQPSQQGYRYCESLLEIAARYGVERVFTFAAMATPILPAAVPRVFAVGTRPELLPELRRDGAMLLNEGEITGLNGVFVAAAAARELPGFCLLGEFPFFAAGVPNPKASAAVLRVFNELSGIRLDMAEIDADARTIERNLTQHLEGLQQAARQAARGEGEGEEPGTEDYGAGFDDEPAEREESAERDEEPGAGEATPRIRPPRRKPLSPEAAERIDQLFVQAKKDRARALELKAELDRLGLFKEFEDRFLDLFKQGG